MLADVAGWILCGCGPAAWRSVSGSGSDPVCTAIRHSVPSRPGGPGETDLFLMLQLMRFSHPALCFKVAGSDSEDSQDSSDSGAATQKTREILARRPSYRWRPQEKTKRTHSSLRLMLTHGSFTHVEKSWTTCHLKRWRTPRGRTPVQLPQASPYPPLPSTRPAPASTVRPSAFRSNRTGPANATVWSLIGCVLPLLVWWSQLL